MTATAADFLSSSSSSLRFDMIGGMDEDEEDSAFVRYFQSHPE